MDWKNFLLGAAGVAGAAFTGGTSLALTGAAIAAHGAKTATDQQVAASKTAAALEQQGVAQGQALIGDARSNLAKAQAQQAQLYQQSQQNLSPYTSLGAGAASLLGQGLGVNVSLPQPTTLAGMGSQSVGAHPPANVTYAPNASALGTTSPANPDGTVTTRGTPLGGQVGTAVPRGGSTLATMAEAHTPIWSQLTRGSSFVRLQAPDGSQKDVPANEVDHWQSLGATIVGA